MVTKKDKTLAAAQKFLERGQLDKALAEFAKVVQEDPKDTRTWLKMAELMPSVARPTRRPRFISRPASSTPSKAFSRKRSRSTRTSSSCRPTTSRAFQAGGGLQATRAGLRRHPPVRDGGVCLPEDRTPDGGAGRVARDRRANPEQRGLAHQARRAGVQAGATDEAIQRVRARGRPAEGAGALRRVHAGRRAAAVPPARQPDRRARAGRSLHRSKQRAARAGQAAGLPEGGAARRRRTCRCWRARSSSWTSPRRCRC